MFQIMMCNWQSVHSSAWLFALSNCKCKPVDLQRLFSNMYCVGTWFLSALDWNKINTFASDVGWDLLFDLNMLLRNGTAWDTSNAETLLKYNNEKGYRIAGWELGNGEFRKWRLTLLYNNRLKVGETLLQAALLPPSPSFNFSEL